ncbi:copper transport protein ATOX1 [Polymixia lowei]
MAPSDSPLCHIISNMTKHEFEVAMTCEGCSGAVTRVLSKLGSDVKFEIDLPKKLVWIESDKDLDLLLETLKKCGKEVKYNGTK